MHNIPDDVIEIVHLLNESNCEAYLVGGCVRDMILGHEPKDWDITTQALYAERNTHGVSAEVIKKMADRFEL
jgi:tRNA nucleotidyltransferase/poly(A) polymerase